MKAGFATTATVEGQLDTFEAAGVQSRAELVATVEAAVADAKEAIAAGTSCYMVLLHSQWTDRVAVPPPHPTFWMTA